MRFCTRNIARAGRSETTIPGEQRREIDERDHSAFRFCSHGNQQAHYPRWAMIAPRAGKAWIIILIGWLLSSGGVAIANEAEERHITLLEQLGGCVCRDRSRPGQPVIRVHLFRSGVKDREMLDLKLFKQLEDLNVTGTE